MNDSTPFGTIVSDRAAVRLERLLKAPVERVWASWTEPERMARWLAPVESGAPGPGETFVLRMQPAESVTCTVTAWDAPRLLELTWHYTGEEPSRLRLTLEPCGEGTRLVLDHAETTDPVDYGAGWHAYLDTLEAHLEERPAPGFDERDRDLRAAYARRQAGFAGGRNIAMKVPSHLWEETVAFYRDVIGLPELENPFTAGPHSAGFAFGATNLWIDRVDGFSQAEIWLELNAEDVRAADRHLKEAGVTRCDEIEPLPEGSPAFWISSPASVIHLVSPR
jgi:uncharacterized protein YndB with AHSA1/START domain